MIDKQKFTAIGAFDELYSPFYWEDIDLSYRAWKAGYKVLFDPTISVVHHHESTIGAYFCSSEIQTISSRNQFIFMWKNVTDNAMVASYLFYFFPNLLYHLLKKDGSYFKGFLKAVSRLPLVLKKRNRQSKQFIYSDKEILQLFYE